MVWCKAPLWMPFWRNDRVGEGVLSRACTQHWGRQKMLSQGGFCGGLRKEKCCLSTSPELNYGLVVRGGWPVNGVAEALRHWCNGGLRGCGSEERGEETGNKCGCSALPSLPYPLQARLGRGWPLSHMAQRGQAGGNGACVLPSACDTLELAK